MDTSIQERLNILEPSYRAFVESDFVSEAAMVFGQTNQLSPEQIDVLDNAYHLWIMLFINDADLKDFIASECQVSNGVAEEAVFFLEASLPEEIVKAREVSMQEMSLVTNQANNTSLTADISDIEESIESLDSIETMAKDMQTARNNEVPSYQSSQDDILQQKDPSARWDSDTRQ